MMAGPDELDADVQLEPQEPGTPPAAQTAGPMVFVVETALTEINAHAAAEAEHEIGGILVGSVIEGARPVVLVEAIIRGQGMAHSRGSVTFTHETWNEINAIKDSRYPDARIVGWYHSHPGFGLFLSGHDLFIHQNFFTAPWQVAIVADPIAKSWGCFTWHGPELAQDPDVHTVAVQWSGAKPDPAPEPPPAHDPIIIAPPATPHHDRGLTWALGLLGLLLAIAVGLLMTTYNDVRLARGQLNALTQQVTTMSHELTALRDRVMDLSEAAPAPAPAEGVPSAAPAAPPAALPPAMSPAPAVPPGAPSS